MIDSLWQDIRFGFVQIGKRLKLSLIIILCIAIGIGPNTTLFSVFNSLLLSEPYVDSPKELVTVFKYRPGKDATPTFTFPDLMDYNQKVSQLEGILGVSNQRVSMVLPTGAEILSAQIVTNNYFDLLGIPAAFGDTFHRQETTIPGGLPQIVLSYNFWQQAYDSNINIIGSTTRLNGTEFTIVGIMPKAFTGITGGLSPRFWLPMEMMNVVDPDSPQRFTSRSANWIMGFGRLVDGATLATVNKEFASIDAELQNLYPETNENVHYEARAFVNLSFIPESSKLGVVIASSLIVGLILLVACSSVAALLLARSTERRQEIAVRMSLGATRGRVIRQLLIESFIIAGIASVIAFLFSLWAFVLLEKALPTSLPISFMLTPNIDANILFYSIAISLISTVLFGLAPALQATKVDIVSSLKDQPQTGGNQLRVSRLRNFFLVIQFALCLFLLIIAGLTTKGLNNAVNIDPGFDVKRLLTFQTDLSMYGYVEEEEVAFIKSLQQNIASLEGVDSVVITRTPPMGNDRTSTFIAPFNEDMSVGESVRTTYSIIGENYFSTLGVSLISGREFTQDDISQDSPVIIVNAAMAEVLFPGENALGRYIGGPSGDEAYEIVGIVENMANENLAKIAAPYSYFPLSAEINHGIVFVAKTSISPEQLIEQVKQTISRLDGDIAVNLVQPMTKSVEASLFVTRALAYVTSGLGSLALTLAVIGTFGVVSFSVNLRQHEIGVRLAIGAKPMSLVFMLMSSGLKQILTGTLLGLMLAFFVSHSLTPILSGISPTDWQVFTLVPMAMFIIAGLSIYLPARKTSRVDPMLALRYE